MPDLDQITVNVTDLIPPDNFATVDAGVKIGSVYTKEQDNEWRKEVELTVQSGIKGVAKPNTPFDPVTNPYPTPWAIGDPNLYEKYDVKEFGTFPNFVKADNSPIEVTSQQISLNKVQIWVKNGISELYLNSNNGKDERLNPVISLENIPESKNKANPLGLLKGYYQTNGVYGDSNNWIHWKGILLPNTTYTVSGLAYLGNVYARIVFFTDGNVYIPPVILATGTANSVTFTTPANSGITAINLQNALGIGLDPQNTVFPNQLQIEVGSVATSFVPYQQATTKEFVDYEKLGNKPLNYSDVYFSFNPIGGSVGKGLLMVYVKRKGSKNKYVGFFVDHNYDMSDEVYTDQWRINYAHNYVFNGSVMSLTLMYGGLYSGDSEFVYKRWFPVEAKDYTGGTHGDEIMYFVNFLVNGSVLDSSVAIPFSSAKEVGYIQRSATYTTPNTGVPATSTHELEAYHNKRTTFGDGGYTVENSLKMVKQVTGWIMTGIACIYKNNASIAFNDDLNKIGILSDNVTSKLSLTGGKEITYSNSNNKLGAKVTASLIDNEALNKTCILFLHDRPEDAKYYRGTRTDNVMAVGTELKSRMKVEFFGD